MICVIKVAESAEEDATELSEKLVFMLSRLIFFQVRVEGATTLNDVLIRRADMFLRGEWKQLYDQYVQEENRERGGRGRKTSLAVQRKRAAELMEEGLVGKSVSMLGESRIVDVGRDGVMDQLKAQVVFAEEGENAGRRLPVKPDTLYTDDRYVCETKSVEPPEGRGLVNEVPVEQWVQEDYIVQALQQLPGHGAQSWDGVRYEHIAALTKEQARWLFEFVLQREHRKEVRWMLTTAKVLPLEKDMC